MKKEHSYFYSIAVGHMVRLCLHHEPNIAQFLETDALFRSSTEVIKNTFVDVGVAMHLDFNTNRLRVPALLYCQNIIDNLNDAFQHRSRNFNVWSRKSIDSMVAESGIRRDVALALAAFLSPECADTPRVRFVLRFINTSRDQLDGFTDPHDTASVLRLKIDRFPSDRRCMNVWISTIEGGVLGFSSFPFGADKETYGMVVDFRTTTSYLAPKDQQRYSMGMTLAHEMGHALGLYHTFTPSQVQLMVGSGALPRHAVPIEDHVAQVYLFGDGAADTPVQSEPTDGNPLDDSSVRVHNDDGEIVFFVSFMDYTDDAAMLTFSKDQCNRINYYLRHDVCRLVDDITDTSCTSYSQLPDAYTMDSYVLVNGVQQYLCSVRPKAQMASSAIIGMGLISMGILLIICLVVYVLCIWRNSVRN